ncbi:MAG TPA: UDP-N-acetylmuramoyl-L-alanyl-D-glutamate--2,6-diaminopimelate ligase [Aquabacterium sp.]|uniref:UDP-N-acetylmuramoyl-L-alanyl-D-glutamate--2, 6-diaminopimelate ligase n=1 Tax=Aquabacterium sp. TaxID=1872578 RepID=UPI002E36C546|nr:UDP-N-acetylmuramoyl-L-alanyl-D-glutamate--2,6-diaminopimelate ligase [Aquabacterium sp.]HEX5372803.1 UDP-N-acetylmuramoyl-L-alanyl-D-glutamate--2,6-diaminopimelate ligase [Aquabacterium sp.]
MSTPSLTRLQNVPEVLAWLRQQGVRALTVDSRELPGRVAQGQAVGFIAWPGAARDGRAFVTQALQQGARAALVEADGVDAFAFADERVAAVSGLKATLAIIAHEFHGRPSEHLEVLAVTGTNGKTSTSWWTAQALSALGRPCGVIGTLGVGRPGGGDFEPTGLTTPDPVTLHATFRQFLDHGLQAAAIEASSIGIEERRLDATRIAVAQFTNFTQDHLDYHGTMEAYWQAKAALFRWPGLRAAVVNADDPQAPELMALADQRSLDLWTYGLHHPARLRADAPAVGADGLRVRVTESDAGLTQAVDQVEIQAALIGDFNVSNLLCVLGGLRALGVSLAQAAGACAGLSAVPGRMQQVRLPGASALSLPLAVVDYAHTPDALHKALLALRPITEARGGRLWCVFGCGGNRDPIKRPLMGAMADQYADEIVLTSDNPRGESPAYILSQILAGVARQDGVAVIENRHEAIAHALRSSAPQDVVLIAGKGHEATQEVAGVKTPFSDVEESMAALRARGVA